MSNTDTGELHTDVANGALVYLSFGPAPWTELLRVLSQHLEITRDRIEQELRALLTAGRLQANGYQVSLPAGGDPRDTKEQR